MKDPNKPPNGFIRIEREFWRSPQVTSLSTPAKLLLVELLYRHNGRNNGRIRMSWQEAQALLKCCKRAVGKYFAELRNAGLVEIAVKGSYDHKDGARKGQLEAHEIDAQERGLVG